MICSPFELLSRLSIRHPGPASRRTVSQVKLLVT
jgi:hypothetical protein